MTEGRGERIMGKPDVTINDPDDVIAGVAESGSGERATGTPNTIYNLSSVLFHALQGGASYETYIEDALREGDEELADFFRRVRDEDSVRADDARLMLARRTLATTAQSEDAARNVAATEEPLVGVAGTEGSEPNVQPRAEGAPSGDPGREYAVTEMPDEDLTPPGEGDVPPRRREEAAAPRPEPSDDFPGTEPVEGEDPTARSGEVPPPPEKVPPERVGEIPTAEEVPPPRAEEVPGAEEVPSGTPPQAPPGDVQRETSRTGQEGTGQPAGEREEDKGLIDRTIDKLTGEEEQRRKDTGTSDRR
jgi:hypothetical protein